MTEGDTYWSLRGRAYRLGPPVEGGGDGVFSVPQSREVVAVIHGVDADLAVCERKVQAMLKRPPALPYIVEDGERFVRMAWPVASLHDTSGRYVGYLMPTVEMQTTSQLECVLQERQARAEGLPTRLGAKINLAARLAVAITELHEQGHRVVYLTPANLRFYTQSLHLALIDCERFSIRADNERFDADADAGGNAAHYLAPEFQDELIPRDKEEAQDRFALAVLVFQLLNFGIHPFTGIPTRRVPTDIAGRIAKNCYAYGLVPNPDMKPSPGSGHLAMPKELRSLFDRALSGNEKARPQAQEWATWLQFYAIPSNNCVVVCSANSRHHHFADLPCAACARAPLLPAVADEVEAPPEDDLADPGEPIVPPFAQPERSYAPARWSAPAKRPPPPAQRWSTLPKPSVFQVVVSLAIVFVMVRYVIPFLSPPTPESRPEAREAVRGPGVPPVMATDPFLAGHPDLAQDEALTDDYVTLAALAIATDDRPQWQREMTNLHTDVPAHEPVLPNGLQPAFERFSAGLSPNSFDEGKRQWLLRQLRQVLMRDPFDDESAYELGWLSLVGGERTAARIYFVQAIWVNPDRANAWYGLGVIGAGDDQKTGALTTAELLATDPAQAESMRKAFPPLLLRLCSVNPRYFAELQAKARHLADQYRPLVAPPVLASPDGSSAASPDGSPAASPDSSAAASPP